MFNTQYIAPDVTTSLLIRCTMIVIVVTILIAIVDLFCSVYDERPVTMTKITCVIVGTDNADKKELLVRISALLSKKTHEKQTEEQDDFEGVNFKVIHDDYDSDDTDDDDDDEIPDIWQGEITVENKQYTLIVHHCPSIESYESSRKLLYLDADVLLMCFSVSLPASLEEVVEKWVPEVRLVCPVTPFILVGTHTEWREIYDQTQTDPATRPVYPETGAIYAERVGAVR